MAFRLQSVLRGLPSTARTMATDRCRAFGRFIRYGGANEAEPTLADLELPRLDRWLALVRQDAYWVRPVWGDSRGSTGKPLQYLLWRREDGQYGLLLPLIDGDLHTTGRLDHGRLTLTASGFGEDGPDERSDLLAFVGVGEDPYALTHEAMAAVADHLRTFRLREQKRTPRFADLLGWCTWDCFHQSIDQRRVLAGLRSFAKRGIPVGYMILDDGWLDVTGDYLNRFTPNPTKFPDGLAPLIDRAKREFGLELFACWHAFEGYWAGINPEGDLAAQYNVVPNEGVIRPWMDDPPTQTLNLVDPDQIHAFYQQWYEQMRSWGVDMVKTDGQSAVEIFTAGKLGRVSTMKRYQQALQGAAEVHFQGNLIHCMSNGSDVAYHMAGSSAWRNNNDNFPKAGPAAQQWHIFSNAYNAMWSRTFALPDWDMFQSHQTGAAFHAAARAISGGPVYVSDHPGRQDAALIRRLVTRDGRVLRCDEPALPTADCLMVDPSIEPMLLKLFSRNGEVGVLGLFHCQKEGATIEGSFRPSDVPHLAAGRYAAYLQQQEELVLLRRDQKQGLALEPVGWELVRLSPIHDGVAPLGLLEKLNGSAAIAWRRRIDRGRHLVELIDGGRIGFYCARKPATVRINGRSRRGKYEESSGLLVLEIDDPGPVTIEITL